MPLVWAVWAAGILSVDAAAPHFIRTWQVENGLPQNKVTAVVQARDGYLWVGTYGGLARFDGARFVVFDDNNTPELHSSRITSLFAAPDTTLWIGDESGGVTQFKNGRFQAVPVHASWRGGKISAIAADEAGDVWLMNESGELARVRDGLVLLPPTGAVSNVVNLTRSSDGKIWVARDGRVSALERGQLRAVDFLGAATNIYVQGIGASRDGGLWVAGDGLIRKWKDGQWTTNLGEAPWGWGIVTCLAEARSGLLWAGTPDAGLYLVSPRPAEGALHFDRANGFPSQWVISLWEDREEDLWAGTGVGLVMIRPANVETVTPPDHWQGRALLSVYASTNGALWVGTEGAGLYRLQNGAWTNFSSEQGIRNSYIWSLAEDDAGRLYAGTWGGGLFVQNGDRFDFAPGLEDFQLPVPALLSTREGLWVGTTAGLLRYRDGQVVWFNQSDGRKLGDVRAIAQDEQGNIWCGMAGNGLACLENQTIRQFKKVDGLSSDFIECLHFDEEGTLWIGTFGGGLNRYKDGEFAVINRRQGLPNGIIGHIEADGLGYFWLSSYAGLIRVSESELNRCADGETQQVQCLTYGIYDGMPTLECADGLQPAGCKTADGRLWFPTAKGLVAVNPAKLAVNGVRPTVIIEEVRMDDKPLITDTSTGVIIPPGRHRLEFRYTGLSFVAPEKARFKYRLDGFDSDWVDAGAERLATYPYIPPGRYSFRVAACNNDGIWNERGASLAVEVLPYFWQTTWFRFAALTLLIAASGGLVWFETRRRMRRKLEQAKRQRDIERERARIARDIHDDLGAQLTRITMISESARSDTELGQADRVATGLEKIYDMSRELTRSMDEIVWAVNPRHDTLESLANYLERFAQDFLTAAGIRCRLDLPVHFPEWPLTADVRHNLFLACKEALHNVVKHSRASEANLRLTVKSKSFELTVADNGHGFSPESKRQSVSGGSSRPAGGNGLENMSRRLSAIGGSCRIESAPGKGTEIVFTVPLQTAPQ
jgi:signal transduction histidine kinase/ligand-binding sensor domain-containing protein